MSNTDVLIVGGGTTGVTLARGLLATTNLSVTLVDTQPFTPDGEHTGFDARVIALARRSVLALSAFGVNLTESDATPITRIQVSDQGGAGLCELSANDMNLPAFGSVVSLATLGQRLHDGLKHERLTVIAPAQVADAEQKDDNVTVTLDNGDTCKAKLLVLADGGRSPLAQSLGLTHAFTPYDQHAIVFNAHTSEPHHGKAYERFTADGPLAFLPFTSESERGHAYSVVWAMTPEKAAALMQATETQFIQSLQQAMGYRQGVITDISERVIYPLGLRLADRVAVHRVAIVGNAAQTLHPIAGQGFNLGLRDILALVEALKQADDPGKFDTLHAFSKARTKDRDTIIGLTDMLVRGFSTTNPLMQGARNLALAAMDNLPELQRAFVRQTTGFGRSTLREADTKDFYR